MLIYKDLISGDELCSNSYPMKLIDDVVYEFEGKSIVVENGISENLIGGNASAEDAIEDVCDEANRTINIIYSNRLVEMSFTKKTYTTYIKGYMKSILDKLNQNNPERAAIFKTNVQKYVTKIMKNFDEYRFFSGESMNPDGMIVLCNYREDQITPYFVFFKDGLEEEKF